MIRQNDIAFISCIERNKKIYNEQEQAQYMLYENEAIRCFMSIRKNGGWLKDADIYCVCCTDLTVSLLTKDLLDALDVKYIETKIDIPCSYKFMNTLYVQQFCCNMLKCKYKYLVYVDLDLEFIKPIEQSMFEQLGYNTSICYYEYSDSMSPELKYRYNNMQKLGGKCFNTYFNVIDAKTLMFDCMLDSMHLSKDSSYNAFFNNYILYPATNDNYFYEEGLFDFMYLSSPLFRDSIKAVPCSVFENILFTHKHMSMHEYLKLQTDKTYRSILK